MVRERRLLPAAQVSKRFSLFDAAGNGTFSSEWVADSTSESVTTNLATACVFSNGSLATARPSSAPGTYTMCFDPFGRPQQIVGSKHSSLHTVDRKDGATWYGDARDDARLLSERDVHESEPPPARPADSRRDDRPQGRLRPHDRLGHGRADSYACGVNGPVGDGDKAPRHARTPTTRPDPALAGDARGGLVTFDAVRSLGNVRQERPGNLAVTRSSTAGRLVREEAGRQYAVHCYDRAAAARTAAPTLRAASTRPAS
jgi:hypothetical protein